MLQEGWSCGIGDYRVGQSYVYGSMSIFIFFLMIRRPPRSTQSRSSAASDVYKRQTILGRGDYMESLRHLARELKVDGRVAFYYELRPAEELPAIILQADAGIVPYRDDPFTDGLLPTKLMEYAALGLPSIAARTTAIERYFEGTMAELFTPNSVEDLASVLKALYADRGRLAALARRADAFNRTYNWTKIGAEYVDLVEHLGTGAAASRLPAPVDAEERSA